MILFVGGATTAWPLMEHAAYVLASLDILAFALVRVSTRGLTISSATDRVRVTAGEEIVERYHIEKRSMWPAAWIQLEYADSAHDSFSLAGGGSRTLDHRLLLTRRGRYQLAAAAATVRDPLGLFIQYPPTPGGYPEPVTVTVHPRPVPTVDAREAVRALTGNRHRWRLDGADATLGELREYTPGDPPSRIHWRTTARRGALMVTDPETVRRRACWLLVDLGGDEATAETAAGIAAYLAGRLWDSGQAIGAIIAGDDVQIVPARRGREQTGQILDALAAVGSVDGPRLATLQRSLKYCVDPGSFVLISPAIRVSWCPLGDRLRVGVTKSGAPGVPTGPLSPCGPPGVADIVPALRAICSTVRLVRVPTAREEVGLRLRDWVA